MRETRTARTASAVAAAIIALGLGAGAASAQSSRKIPIQQDLQRDYERRAEETGSIRHAPEHVQSDPTGVAGFSGPPGIYGDSVGGYGPLPPGAPGNESW